MQVPASHENPKWMGILRAWEWTKTEKWMLLHGMGNNRALNCPADTHRRNNANQCNGPPNFFAVVLKKQEISQQVVTRMQDLAMSFQKFAGGDTPWPSQQEGATPTAPNTQPGLAGRGGASAPVLRPNPGSPSTFQPWLRPWLYCQTDKAQTVQWTERMIVLFRPSLCVCLELVLRSVQFVLILKLSSESWIMKRGNFEGRNGNLIGKFGWNGKEMCVHICVCRSTAFDAVFSWLADIVSSFYLQCISSACQLDVKNTLMCCLALLAEETSEFINREHRQTSHCRCKTSTDPAAVVGEATNKEVYTCSSSGNKRERIHTVFRMFSISLLFSR